MLNAARTHWNPNPDIAIVLMRIMTLEQI